MSAKLDPLKQRHYERFIVACEES